MLSLVPNLNATFLFLLTLSAGAIILLHPVGHWRCHEAWKLYEAEAEAEAERGGLFDVVHSESVALLHRWARDVPNLAVSWHVISLETLHSGVYQDLALGPDEPRSPGFNRSLAESIYRDVGRDQVLPRLRPPRRHQRQHRRDAARRLPDLSSGRIHVLLNGVDEDKFAPDVRLGAAFRKEIILPGGAALVMGVAGRLVNDNDQPLPPLRSFLQAGAEAPGRVSGGGGIGAERLNYIEYIQRLNYIEPSSLPSRKKKRD